MKIALLTCQELPEPDADRQLTQSAIHAVGIQADWVPWDGPPFDPAAYDAILIRSTWNYHLQLPRFLDTLHRLSSATRLLNPLSVVQANVNKSYLLGLDSPATPIVPTIFVTPESPFPEFLPWDRFVVKPAVSAGSYLTRAFDSSEIAEAKAFASSVVRHSPAMIQQFIPSAEFGGETAWVWIDGKVTHGVRKSIRLAGSYEAVSSAVFPTPQELGALAPFQALIPKGALYARIDVMEHEGRLLLSELEMIEPSLFFAQNPESARELALGVHNKLMEQEPR